MPARDRRQDRNRISGLDLGIQLLLIPNIVLVDEDVNESPDGFAVFEYTVTKTLELDIKFSQDLTSALPPA